VNYFELLHRLDELRWNNKHINFHPFLLQMNPTTRRKIQEDMVEQFKMMEVVKIGNYNFMVLDIGSKENRSLIPIIINTEVKDDIINIYDISLNILQEVKYEKV
jgi:hypothetical protein